MRIQHDWREARTKSQRPYYYNSLTNESSWDPPAAEYVIYAAENGGGEEDEDLPPGWHSMKDEGCGKIFWYHDDGKSTTWYKPDWVPQGWIPDEAHWEEYTSDQGRPYYYNAR